MPGPWPITLITWNQLEQDAEPPVFEFGGIRLFKGPGGQKGPNYMAVMRRPEDALEMAHHATDDLDAWSIDVVGTFNTLEESKLKEPLAESCNGLMVGLTDCRSEEERYAFNTWYRDVHAADVIRAGFHETAFRYRNDDPSGTPQYCALYETRQGGFEAFKALMQHYREHPSPVEDFCLVRHVWALEAVPF